MSAAGRRRPVPDDQFGGRLKGCFLLDLEVVGVRDIGGAQDAPPTLRTVMFRSPDLVGFTWLAGQDVMLTIPGDRRAARRRYTIRRTDPVAGTLDIDVVLHGDGPFARWASSATPGEHIEGIGPRGAITLVEGAPHHLFVGDESAMAATFAMLEAVPAGAGASAILGADDGTAPAMDPPSAVATVDVSWVAVDDVVDRLGSVPLPGGTVAYVNGERSLVQRAAAVLAERGLPSDAVFTKAYWRRDRANADHGEPARD